MGRGATFAEINKEMFEEIRLPVPPLDEQKRLAFILAKANRIRRIRRYALEVSDAYLQNVFLEMFGDPVTNTMGWERATFAELGNVQTGNTPSREDEEKFGVYIEWVKSDNIIFGQMSVERSREGLSAKGLKFGRYVEAGSVLLVCIAGSSVTIGNAALTDRRVAFNQQINAITPVGEVDPGFLYGLCLLAKPLIQRSTTEGMKRIITKSKLEQLLLIKPPLPLQQKFAQIVARHERLRAQQREAARQAEGLFKALLQKIFNDK
jgi:type I restriction enzyme, S subunit